MVDVILQALRDYAAEAAARSTDLTPTQRADYEALRALAREAAKHKLPGATSDHSDMYDEFGLAEMIALDTSAIVAIALWKPRKRPSSG